MSDKKKKSKSKIKKEKDVEIKNSESVEKTSETEELTGFSKAIHEIIDPFKSLGDTSRSLWGIYISYILEGTVYFGILTILGKYLSENVGLTDLHAGWVYSVFTGGITLAMLFLGGIADKIGVRKALLIALGLLVLGRLTLWASSSFFPEGGGALSVMFIVVMVGLLLVDIGYGMYQPASYAGVKQFTDKRSATMAYAMIYGLMNLGAFFSGLLSPPLRRNFGMSSVYLTYFLLTMAAFLSVLLIMSPSAVKRNTLTDIDEEKDDEKESSDDEDGEKQDKKKPRLMTPAFIGMIVLLFAALGTIIYLNITQKPGPASKPIDEASALLAKTGKSIVPNEKDNKGVKIVNENLAKAPAVIGAIKVPTDLPSYAKVDKSTYLMLRINMENGFNLIKSAQMIQHDPAKQVKTSISDSSKKELIKLSRSVGVYYMAAAYSLVGKFDSRVLKRIRQRQSDPDESMIPLSDDFKKKISKISDYSEKDLLENMAKDFTAFSVRAGIITKGSGIDLVFNNEIEFFNKLSKMYAGKGLPGSVSAFLVDRFYGEGTFLIKSVKGIINNKKITSDKIAINIISKNIATVASLSGSMKTAASSAVSIPVSKKLSSFFMRYGIFILIALLSVIFLIIILLKKRPEHPFHDGRFVFFIFVLIPVQTLFAHNWLTLPYYINRVFAGTTVGNNFEFFSNINPILIFFLTPFVAALTARRKVYNMMIWGTMVMALPTFLLVLPASPVMLLTYILLMSVGEAMWQPRFLQWVAEIAPKGQTGAYMGIAQFPWFLTKVITGIYSGMFLAKYVPKVGPQNPEMMWLIYAVIAMSTPIILILAKGWMTKAVKKAKENKETPKEA